MKRSRRDTLPLGVDFGRGRIRIAVAERDANGRAKLIAVAARPTGANPAAAVAEALAELQTPERRCVFGITQPEAIMRIASFPPMSRRERTKAARYEAARYIEYALDQADVSIVPAGDHRWTIGVARRDAIAARVSVAKRARLVPLAIDDVAFALQRVHLDADGAIDVGEDATTVTIFARPIPLVTRIPIGGSALTEAIARSLGLDALTAEERKRTIGFAGAGEAARDDLLASIADVLAAARAAGHATMRRFVMTGNGSRVPGFADAVERAIAYDTKLAELDPGTSEILPADVLRAAGPDWSIAYGLSLWDLAAS